LGQLAKEWRTRCDIPVVGITGSNGKTTVKEMTAGILAIQYNVMYTHGNLNNDLGVPLTLFRLQEENEYAVIEMGANHAGEIAYVSSLAKPDVAVITNAGSAHLEGFGSIEGVANAKGELIESLSDSGTAVLNGDDQYLGLWRRMAADRKVMTFGYGEECDVRGCDVVYRLTKSGFETEFKLDYRGTKQRILLHLPGQHNVSNALASATVALALDIDIEQIQEGLQAVKPVKGRMQTVAGLNGCRLINDSYNSNPSSFFAAIDVLSQLEGETYIVMGSFAELGERSKVLHEQVGSYAREKGITRFYSTGLYADFAAKSFGNGGEYFAEQSALIEAVTKNLHEHSIVLVKGSRSQRMERVVDLLCDGRSV